MQFDGPPSLQDNQQGLEQHQGQTDWKTSLTGDERLSLITTLSATIKELTPTSADAKVNELAKTFDNVTYQRSLNKSDYLKAYHRKLQQIRFQIAEQRQLPQAAEETSTFCSPHPQVITMAPTPSLVQESTPEDATTTTLEQQAQVHQQIMQQRLMQLQQFQEKQQQIQQQEQQKLQAEQQRQSQPPQEPQLSREQQLQMTLQLQLQHQRQVLLQQQAQQLIQQQIQQAQQQAQQQAKLGMDWRSTLTSEERLRLIQRLANSLKALSPTIADAKIVELAKTFEDVTYQRSPNKETYIANYARKLQKIQHLIATQHTGAGIPPVATLGGSIQQAATVETRPLLNSTGQAVIQPLQGQQTIVGHQLQQDGQPYRQRQDDSSLVQWFQDLHLEELERLNPQQQTAPQAYALGSTTNPGQPTTTTPSLMPLTNGSRVAAAATVQTMTERIHAKRVPPTLLDNLSAEQKQSVKEQMSQMMPMFMKLDQLMPIFFAMTGNLDATARLVLLKFMFQDQLDAMEHEEYTISPGNLVRLKEELQHYFMWVKTEMMGTHPQGGQGAAPQPEVKAEPQEETFQHAA